MMLRISVLASAACLAYAFGPLCLSTADEGDSKDTAKPAFRGALLAVDQVTESRLRRLVSEGYNAVALQLNGGAEARAGQTAACDKIRGAGFDLCYWIEVARCEELADQHPRWMASLQGHSEWRRLFRDPPVPGDGEVVKTYPWVPILNREPFDGQLARVQQLLADRSQASVVFLNDLQGAPSACGCGNQLCRWTSDYGDIRTVTPLGDDAPARFVARVAKLAPESKIIPVWTTECEEHDGAADGHCAGVGCFKGICWRAYTRQLMPLVEQSPRIGVLLPYRELDRDLPVYGEQAGWIAHAVKTFQTMPPRHQGKPVAPSRLIAVLQGWDTTEQQIKHQIRVAERAGVCGVLVAYAEIQQAWEPRILKLR